MIGSLPPASSSIRPMSATADAGDPIGPVGGREGVLVALVELGALLLAVLLDAARRADRRSTLAWPARAAPRSRRHRRRRGHAVAAVDDVVHAREQRLGELQRPVDVGPAECLDQDPPDALAVLGVEAIARDADQARDEAVERVAADEQPHALALAEAEDPHRHVEQLVGLDLEQRVARVGLEDLEQRLGVMAVRRESGPLQAPPRPCRAASGTRCGLAL